MLTPEQRRIGRRNFVKALGVLPVAVAFSYSIARMDCKKSCTACCPAGSERSTTSAGAAGDQTCSTGESRPKPATRPSGGTTTTAAAK